MPSKITKTGRRIGLVKKVATSVLTPPLIGGVLKGIKNIKSSPKVAGLKPLQKASVSKLSPQLKKLASRRKKK